VQWDTQVPSTEEPLDFQSALTEIRGVDHRPLLVMRDCDMCKGKDDALLSKTLDNEKTLLYTRFFHCVKLDRRVVDASHPWHALFADEKPPHLFLASYDGSIVEVLPGTQSQKELWSTMIKVLKNDYQRDAVVAVREWLRVLDKFDSIDSRQKELTGQIDEQIMKGNKSRESSLRKELAALDKEREGAYSSEKRLIELILKHAPKEKTTLDFDLEAAAETRESGGGLLDRIKKDGDGKPSGGN
jgi:hypothetical protein